jgi:hypothetical protein
VSKTALLLGQSIQLRTQVKSFEAVCHKVAAGGGVSIVLNRQRAACETRCRFPWSGSTNNGRSVS